MQILPFTYCFRKALFSKCFPTIRERNAGGLEFLRFEGRFRDGLMWTADLTVQVELPFQIPSL